MSNHLTNEIHAFEADHEWVIKNREILLQKYADQWVAVKNSKVIASDPEFSGLLSKVSDPSHTCVEFITRDPIGMIL